MATHSNINSTLEFRRENEKKIHDKHTLQNFDCELEIHKALVNLYLLSAAALFPGGSTHSLSISFSLSLSF